MAHAWGPALSPHAWAFFKAKACWATQARTHNLTSLSLSLSLIFYFIFNINIESMLNLFIDLYFLILSSNINIDFFYSFVFF